MIEPSQVETLLQDAIALLDESGFPLAAESLRDNLRAIRTAPTAGARRRRTFQLRDLFEGPGPGPDVHYGASRLGPNTERYRRTLEAIQEILACGVLDGYGDPMEWRPRLPRVA